MRLCEADTFHRAEAMNPTDPQPPASQALCPACGATSALPAPCTACGADLCLQGRYLLRRVLGANIGTTYLADDVQSGAVVVVKELAFARLDAWKTEELFRREAEVLRQLAHPRIPRYLDAFSTGQGKQLRSYLVQQHLEGRDLRAELAERRYSDDDVLGLMDEVLVILEYLQRLRPPLIHRDLKPSNLMRLRDGQIALIDFGSVRDLLTGAEANATVAGTFGFMAPEQFRGEAFLQTDLYGLGAVAVQLLARVSPEKLLGTGTELLWKPHVRAAAPLVELLEKLLAPEPSDRPADACAARELVALTRARLQRGERAIEETRTRAQRSAPPPETEVDAGRPTAKRRLPLMLALGVVVLAAGTGSVVALLSSPRVARTASRPAPVVATAPLAQAPARRPGTATARQTPDSRQSPAARAPEALARELPAGELIGLLTASPWEGAIGRIVFAQTAGGLGATLRPPGGGPVAPFQKVLLGELATLTLTLVQRAGGVTTTDTFHGALSADRRVLFGSHEKRYREGMQEQKVDGSWQVTAATPP